MIESYFNATVDKINNFLGTTGSGKKKTNLVGQDVDCRWKEEEKLIRDDKGNEVVASVEVWLPADTTKLTPQSEIVKDGKSYEVIRSGYKNGISSPMYLRVFLK